jgi:pseudouridine kinase
VGRNIAENLSRLGVPVKLLTVVGDDVYGEKLLADTRRSGVDIGHVRRVAGESSGIYLSVLDENGDMAVAVSSMEILNWLDSGYLRENQELLEGGRLTVFDANLTLEALEYGTGLIAGQKKYLDLVSVTKALKVKSLLGRFYCIKPNRLEAEALTGFSAASHLGLRRNAEYFHDAGVAKIFITLGTEGVYFSDGTERGVVRALSAVVVSATGAGDAFVAGILHAELTGLSTAEAAVFGTGAALLALASGDTVSSNISPESIKRIMVGNYEIWQPS